MASVALSPELQCKIIRSLSPTQTTPTLHSLCLTSKAFRRDAEPHLYASLCLTSAHQAHLACRTLAANKRLAGLVRAFWFNDETQAPSSSGAGHGRGFWEGVRSALGGMQRLKRLCLFDTELGRAFQLHEAKLHFAWDARLVAFLATQRALHTLHTIDSIDDAVPRLRLPPRALPALQRFDGTLMVAHNVLALAPPLTNLQAAIEDPVHAPAYLFAFLRRLAGVANTLRALSVLDIPEGLAPSALDTVAGLCPNLMYIGLVPLPPVHRHTVYAPLAHLHNLHTAQFDLTTWTPHPDVRAQRAVACEVRTFSPAVVNLVFWVGNTRVRWAWVPQAEKTDAEGQWLSQIDGGQYPTFDHMWSLV